jgi:predicted dehydrogenase
MSNINRRRFLGQSVAAASTVFAAPYILRAQNPNGKMGVAVVGVKGRGGSHLDAFAGQSKTNVVCIVEVDENVARSRAEGVAKRQQGNGPRVVRDMRDILEDPSIDIISTATPNHWHALCGVWAMQAGKDVYVEKPISHNIAEGSAMVAAANKYGRVCQTGTQCRSNPAIIDAMKFIADGGIGEVNFSRGLCYKRRKSIGALGDFPVPQEVDFNLWSGPAPYTDPKVTRPQFHYDWHWQRLYGNGDSGNQGPHQTDIARWGLGVNSHPIRIISYGGRLGYQAERKDDNYVDAGDTANTQVTIYDYGDKCMVFETRGLSVDDSADEELNRLFQSTKGNKVGVVFYGSGGYLVQRTYDDCIAYDKDMNEIKRFRGGSDRFHFENFLDVCASRKMEDLNADAWEGHLSAGLSHLGNISYYLGEKNKVSAAEAKQILSGVKSLDDNLVTLERTLRHLTDNGVDLAKYPISMGPCLEFDPVKEVFPDSPEATAMVSREYRDGFACPTAEQV